MTGLSLDIPAEVLDALAATPEFLDAIADRVADRLARNQPEPWIGVPAAAAHIGCKPQRIYDLVSQRAIPHRKEGSRVLLRRTELDAWLQEPTP